ncbi:prenyltransferase [Wenzhouxiangella marina]|uniref:Ubiquinone biosynthesis protein UbiA n=1 Tax=Wenzhouxiangella marina TaxID=1579979 RepID=A0A0K0XZG8_9GAMM|nr:prenyltransferase [Wenzhouxiangella marina]AKS43083.1 Ubiquinone biosynthesis protein UbiA [Wenzhouxiangella marina]MBB6087233.1 1,4-dihydroxy-2-naphthoate octaprenyltransferase [Wenzhouxiangella marina]
MGGRFATLVRSSRPPFLILALLVVALAIASALWQGAEAEAGLWLTMLLVAVAGHVSANAFNEYFDYRSGLDEQTTPTPFSGGSGALPERPEFASAVLALAWLSLLLTAALGFWLAISRAPTLLLLGALGLVLVYGYTRWFHRSALLCYLAPGLGFGGVIYLGSAFLLNGSLTRLDLLLSLVIGLLASNLLLLNQFPDMEPDRRIGRRHFPIVLGRPKSARLHAAGQVLALLLLIAALVTRWLPAPAALGLLPFALLPALIRRSHRHADDVPGLLPALAWNVMLTLAVPALLAIGLLLGRS